MSVAEKILTEDEYVSRRAELERCLAVAKKNQARAEREAAVGDLSDAELEEAREPVRNTEGKLRGLEIAFTESQRIAEAEAEEAEKASRREAAQKGRTAAAKRAKAFKSIVEGILALAPYAKAHREAREELGQVGSAHRTAFAKDPVAARDQYSLFLSDALDTNREGWLLQAKLFEVLGDFQIGLQSAAWEWSGVDLDEFNATRCRAALKRLERLTDEDEEEGR